MWDAILFGEFVFPAGGVGGWTEEVGKVLAKLAAFDDAAEREVAQVLVTEEGAAVRAYFRGSSFKEWCPRLLTLFAKAARRGACGDVAFVPVGDAPAYRCTLARGKARLDRMAAPPPDEPLLREIREAVAEKIARRSLSDFEEAFLARTERRAQDR